MGTQADKKEKKTTKVKVDKSFKKVVGEEPVITETLPLQPNVVVAPDEFVQPENINNTENNITMNDAACTTQSTDGNIPMDTQAHIDRLEKIIDDLNKRQSWQEQIHRNIMPNGNVTHYYNIMPSLGIAALTGAFTALIVVHAVNYFKSKN